MAYDHPHQDDPDKNEGVFTRETQTANCHTEPEPGQPLLRLGRETAENPQCQADEEDVAIPVQVF